MLFQRSSLQHKAVRNRLPKWMQPVRGQSTTPVSFRVPVQQEFVATSQGVPKTRIPGGDCLPARGRSPFDGAQRIPIVIDKNAEHGFIDPSRISLSGRIAQGKVIANESGRLKLAQERGGRNHRSEDLPPLPMTDR